MVSDHWRISVDGDTCIGAGICAGTAPAAFRLVNGVSTPIHETVDADDAVRAAAESCPVEAITVRDRKGAVIAPEP
ncbi:ferredoxin [Micromonospora sp. CPCC 205371]|nr:ferredoxin [Micromonospora sp. CPCC 205371]